MLKIDIAEQNNAAILNIEGEIDLYSSPKVREALLKLAEKKHLLIIVNLEKVSYMDSSALATLIEGWQKSAGYGGKFRLAALQDSVKDVFELSNLDKVFEIFTTVDEVLQAS